MQGERPQRHCTSEQRSDSVRFSFHVTKLIWISPCGAGILISKRLRFTVLLDSRKRSHCCPLFSFCESSRVSSYWVTKASQTLAVLLNLFYCFSEAGEYKLLLLNRTCNDYPSFFPFLCYQGISDGPLISESRQTRFHSAWLQDCINWQRPVMSFSLKKPNSTIGVWQGV